jgi:hypothetical protein
MERKKSKPLKIAFVMAGLLALVIALWSLKRGSPISLEKDEDYL